MGQLIFIKCHFFLDTNFSGFYTFVNCKVSLAGSMSTRQRENRNNGNQESSSKEASEEGSQENCKEEVSRQRNRQHNRGTPKASPDVFLGEAESPVLMRLQGNCAPGDSSILAAAILPSLGCAPISLSDFSPFSRVPCGVTGVETPRARSKTLTKVVFRHDTLE